jgi:tRNA/rRNA methyltransferase
VKRLVLVRPSGPRNVGMIVRVAANFGPCEIVLVTPERPSLLVHPEFEQMAHGVPDMKSRCPIVGTLAEALADCTHSIGFTARAHDNRRRLDWRNAQGDVALRANDSAERVALVFGNETSGLSVEETLPLSELVHIATSAEHTSLNLAIATGIVLSDLFTEQGVKRKDRGVKSLSGEGREFLKASLKHILGDKVARTPQARRDIIASIERLFSRAPMENRDARAWHLMMRALGSELTPKDLELELNQRRGRRKESLAQALEKKRRVVDASNDSD